MLGVTACISRNSACSRDSVGVVKDGWLGQQIREELS